MEYLAHSIEGFVHFVTAMIAMIAGTVVLFSRKGTLFHKRWGYVYFGAMAIMLCTSFMIYRLFNGVGIFHYAAIASSITLVAGFVPLIWRQVIPNWLEWHFSMMYWSVIGLYAAFLAEAFTRIPSSPFLGMVGITFLLTMIVGGVYWRKLSVKWSQLFPSSRIARHKSNDL